MNQQAIVTRDEAMAVLIAYAAQQKKALGRGIIEIEQETSPGSSIIAKGNPMGTADRKRLRKYSRFQAKTVFTYAEDVEDRREQDGVDSGRSFQADKTWGTTVAHPFQAHTPKTGENAGNLTVYIYTEPTKALEATYRLDGVDVTEQVRPFARKSYSRKQADAGLVDAKRQVDVRKTTWSNVKTFVLDPKGSNPVAYRIAD